MNAIAKRFSEKKSPALMPYLCAGYPDPHTFRTLLRAAADGGADFVEVGIPFSDPIADGPAIQHASHQALLAGTTPAKALEWAAALEGPLKVAMTYANPVLSMGAGRFMERAAAAGFSGAIVPDLPSEGVERPSGTAAGRRSVVASRRARVGGPTCGSRPKRSHVIRAFAAAPHCSFAAFSHGLDLIPMVAPTTPTPRLRTLVAGRGGFVYLVSVAGVTGARKDLPPGLPAFVNRVKKATPLPVCVGFGIATPAHARAVGRFADGVIVGSAIVRIVREAGARNAPGAVRRFLESMRRALDAARD
jgi:tryptophan synthase alpha chain